MDPRPQPSAHQLAASFQNQTLYLVYPYSYLQIVLEQGSRVITFVEDYNMQVIDYDLARDSVGDTAEVKAEEGEGQYQIMETILDQAIH
ncbi:hypothetical protein EON65_48425 [archaeon]|nr:MAG: hypothetical protein EON65_48425 [archaeon]